MLCLKSFYLISIGAVYENKNVNYRESVVSQTALRSEESLSLTTHVLHLRLSGGPIFKHYQ